MSEIEVVVDVRQSPDTAELIIVKQKLVSTGELQPTGPPVEMRLGLTNRKAQLFVFTLANPQNRHALAVKVKNVSVVPFEIDRVAVECQFEDVLDIGMAPGIKGKHIASHFDLVPLDSAKKGVVQPGEMRDYFLPPEMLDRAALLCQSLNPGQYWVAAQSGGHEVGRLRGEWVRPYFDLAGVVIHRRALPLFETLSHADRLALVGTVALLRRLERESWTSESVQPVEGLPNVYTVQVTPELRALVTQTENQRIEVVDIVREATLDQFGTADSAAGEKR
jgi:hypothetical protein